MSNAVINVQRLSKQYRLGLKVKNNQSFTGQIVDALRSPVTNFKRLTNLGKFNGDEESIFWALQDINFSVNQGEILGIIGRNGAGKSTLLKILSRITEPTSGEVTIKGRVASLLEVGTGFHPELTGRENIYMNGTILGMTKKEIDRKFEEIIDFSGVEKFLDTPVKFYSSGMKVRLGFSVAAHLEPEILVIDEVLAVGDHEFQKKCLGKMENVAGQGRTVLFVSHNMQAVSTLTTKALVLNKGNKQFEGPTADGIASYLQLNQSTQDIYQYDGLYDRPLISSVKLHTSEPNNIQAFKKVFRVELELFCGKDTLDLAVSYQVCDEYENPIFHELFISSEYNFDVKRQFVRIESTIEELKLYPGKYFLKVFLADNRTKTRYDHLERVCPFVVEVFGLMRDYYWKPNQAKYVEGGLWKAL